MTQEEIKEYNEHSRKEYESSGKTGFRFFFSFVLPLILYIFGMMTPVVTDDFFVWTLSLVPFYGICFFICSLNDNEDMKSNVMGNISFSFISSIILFILGIFFKSEGVFGTITTMGSCNIVPCLGIFIVLAIGKNINI